MRFGNIRKSFSYFCPNRFWVSSDLRPFERGLKSAHRNLSLDLQQRSSLENAPCLSREARRAFVAMSANDISAPISLQQFSTIRGCALVSGSSLLQRANGQRNLNFSATCVSHSIGCPFKEEGWYCQCFTASMAAGTRTGGPLRSRASRTAPS